jgi:transposase
MTCPECGYEDHKNQFLDCQDLDDETCFICPVCGEYFAEG